MKERLQKIISSYGIASRRAAEKIISNGQVKVNGRIAELGSSADPERDIIEVDGKIIKTRPRRVYIMLNKPRGYVTTMRDEKGRKTVTDLINDLGEKVYPVGRLDIDSEGLLIMTNNGELTNRLTHPSYKVHKVYRVWVTGEAIDKAAGILKGDMTIDGQKLNKAGVKVLRDFGDAGILDITISEGKNRQIRRMCKQAGLNVSRLVRISECGLSLGGLPKGKWRFLSESEINNLKSV